PGVTTFDEAETVLRTDDTLSISARPGRTLCWTTRAAWHGCIGKWGPGNSIEDMALYLPDDVLRLGDALSLFGTPDLVRLCWFTSYSNVFVMATLAFGNNVEVAAYSPRYPLRWTLD